MQALLVAMRFTIEWSVVDCWTVDNCSHRPLRLMLTSTIRMQLVVVQVSLGETWVLGAVIMWGVMNLDQWTGMAIVSSETGVIRGVVTGHADITQCLVAAIHQNGTCGIQLVRDVGVMNPNESEAPVHHTQSHPLKRKKRKRKIKKINLKNLKKVIWICMTVIKCQLHRQKLKRT